jgi:hypothetical protein
VKLMTHLKIRGLCLAGLCLTAVFAFGPAGSASAKVLLFVPSTTPAFPFHLSGNGGPGTLETVKGAKVTSTAVDALAIILSATLFDAHLEFLGSKAEGLVACNTAGNASGVILINLLGHLGLADPGDSPAVLLLLPSGGFEFSCGILGSVKVRGSVIGLITAPGILKSGQTSMTLKFEQAKGVQKHTSFLLGESLLTNQIEESAALGGGFEQSGQSGEATLKATSGSFEIKDE